MPSPALGLLILTAAAQGIKRLLIQNVNIRGLRSTHRNRKCGLAGAAQTRQHRLIGVVGASAGVYHEISGRQLLEVRGIGQFNAMGQAKICGEIYKGITLCSRDRGSFPPH